MNTKIQAYQPANFQIYQRGVGGPDAARPKPQATAERPSAPSPAASTLAQAVDPPALSGEERQMIDQYFPQSPELSLRLYGPNRQAQAITPSAVGSRLDLRG